MNERGSNVKEWQFNILFFVAVGGAIFILIAPELGFESTTNPTAVTGIGAILTYVLTQKKLWTHKDEPPETSPEASSDSSESEVEK